MAIKPLMPGVLLRYAAEIRQLADEYGHALYMKVDAFAERMEQEAAQYANAPSTDTVTIPAELLDELMHLYQEHEALKREYSATKHALEALQDAPEDPLSERLLHVAAALKERSL